jgi:peptidyl-prolyl cis-trans isomerase SurA
MKNYLLSIAACVLLVAAPRAEILEQILVKVNGEIFTKTDLEQRQVQALRQRGQQIDLKAEAANQQLRKALDDITPQIMADVVNEMLVVQRGRELGYSLSNEQFTGILDNIKKENKLESDEQFQAALKTEGMTLADLRRQLERQMIRQKVEQNEVLSKIGITETEARSYYEAHMNEFTTPPSVTLREILVTVPADSRGVNVGAEEAAKKRAEDIRARVISGADGATFEAVASTTSDSPSKANGGLIGPLSVLDLSPELRKVIEPMKAGDISAPLRTARGYQLIKLEARTETRTMPFDQAREQISERVFTDKRKAEYLRYLEKLRAQAIIEWKNDDVKKAFDEGLKQMAAAATQ